MSQVNELRLHLKQNNFILDPSKVAALYKRTGVWPDVERLMKRTLIRNIRKGFIHVQPSVRFPQAGLEHLAMETGVFLVRHIPVSSMVEVWGPSDAAVSACIRRLISMVKTHSTARTPRSAQQ